MRLPRFRWSTRASFITLSTVLVIGLGILSYRHVIPTVITTGSTALYVGYDTADGLERASDVVVVARVAGKGRSIVDDYRHYTITPLEVEQVYKGELLPGDVIEFVEPGGYERKLSGLYFLGSADYVQITQSSSYMLFLRESREGSNIYFPTGGSQGKFVWPPPQERTEELLEVVELDGDCQRLFNSVVAKYGESE